MKLKNIRKNIVIQWTARELLIYDLNLNKAFCLNETAALIWESCDGILSIGEIRKAVEKRFNVALTDEFVLFAISRLHENGLLENEPEIERSFAGRSRRELIRKIGYSSAIALPLIASVVAPSPAQAQSACVPLISGCQCVTGYSSGQDCTGDTQFNNCGPGCRCIASPGFDDCLS